MDEQKNHDLKTEVVKLFLLLGNYRSKRLQRLNSSEESKASRRSYIALGLGLIILVAVLLATKHVPLAFWMNFEKPRVMLQGLFLIVYGTGIVVALFIFLDLLSMKAYLKDPTGYLIHSLNERSLAEINLFSQLHEFSTESINYVRDNLELGSEQLNMGKSLLIGATEKIGIVPGLIATIIAFNKASSTTVFTITEGISIGLGVLYLFMIPLAMVAVRFKGYGVLFDQYLKLYRK